MRIYIAGPYGDHNSKEIIAENVRRADELARYLVAQGHEVYCPHKMSWGWEDSTELTRDDFRRVDRSFMEIWAQAVYRLPGKSPGADEECQWAKDLNLSIVYVVPLAEG